MESNPFSLEGKSVLITGASSGIGFSTAKICAEMGATIIATGRNEERLNHLMYSLDSPQHKAIICDLTVENDIEDLVAKIPKLDGIVLCAGINKTVPLGFLSRKKVDTIFNTNLFSQIELLRLTLKRKLLKDGASVVAISSVGGTSLFSSGAAAYGASKAALLSWMKTAAKELAPRFRVNCIAPGAVNTPMNAQGDIDDTQYDAFLQSVPLKRFAEPEEIAFAAVYLLSDCSKYATGSVLTLDGGVTL